MDYVGDIPKYPRKERPKPQLGAFAETLGQWLEADAQLPRKQKRTAPRLFEGLQKAGYQGAYDSVQRWVKVWKVTTRPSLHKAFIPLSFRLGEGGESPAGCRRPRYGDSEDRLRRGAGTNYS